MISISNISTLNKEKFTLTLLKDYGSSLKRLMKHHGISKERFLYLSKKLNGCINLERKVYVEFLWN